MNLNALDIRNPGIWLPGFSGGAIPALQAGYYR